MRPEPTREDVSPQVKINKRPSYADDLESLGVESSNLEQGASAGGGGGVEHQFQIVQDECCSGHGLDLKLQAEELSPISASVRTRRSDDGSLHPVRDALANLPRAKQAEVVPLSHQAKLLAASLPVSPIGLSLMGRSEHAEQARPPPPRNNRLRQLALKQLATQKARDPFSLETIAKVLKTLSKSTEFARKQLIKLHEHKGGKVKVLRPASSDVDRYKAALRARGILEAKRVEATGVKLLIQRKQEARKQIKRGLKTQTLEGHCQKACARFRR